MFRIHFRYDPGPLCALLHGASASRSGFVITLFNPDTTDDAKGHGSGHRINGNTMGSASGESCPSWCISPASLTPEWWEKEWACPEKHFRYDLGPSCAPL